MATYLLTWNPNEWAWEDIDKSSREVSSGKSVFIEWSCGNTKKIQKGDRVFVLRQSAEPKGICASGIVIEGSFEGENWKGNSAQFIKLKFDTLLNPETEKVLPRHLLNKAEFSRVRWDIQRSGITIYTEVAAELEKHWTQFSNKPSLSNADQLETEQQKVEAEGYFDTGNLEDARRRVITSIVQRRGQSEFRLGLLNAYAGQCPITNCNIEAAIEAAHIMSYRGDKSNHITNGLPLRADIHILFDLHLLSIHPDTYRVLLSPEVASSSNYGAYAGQKLRLPQNKAASPDRTALRNHYEVFLQKHEKPKQKSAT
ncbi:MAG: HNH endonuclease [Tildeniella nuda ZEHNDER 1965/U140]|jgi:hypothetical protein|nr:HNH endonuclease [Tildeniella nuda ZEHNDER 1965/U140]